MKQVLVIFILSISALSAYNQNWEPLGIPFQSNEAASVQCGVTNPESGGLIVGGGFVDDIQGNVYSRVAEWDGSEFSPLGCGFTNFCDSIWAEHWALGPRDLIYFQDTLYAGGFFEKSDSVTLNNIAKWDGQTWLPVGLGFNDAVTDLAVHDGALIAGGIFTQSGENLLNGLARWNGLEWEEFNDFPMIGDGINFVLGIESFEGQLYVGGNLNADPELKDFVTWNGSEWTDVGTGFCGNLTAIYELTVFQEKLIVGGSFLQDNCIENPGNFIAAWDGQSWDDMNGGFYNPIFPFDNHQVNSMWANETHLYVAGTIHWVGNSYTDRVASWDGMQWCTYECPNYPNSVIHPLQSVAEYQGHLIVGGAGTVVLDEPGLGCLMHFENQVDSCLTVSIAEHEKFDIQIFPNPSDGDLIFQLPSSEAFEIKVIDLLGHVVVSRSTYGQREVSVNIENCASGLYLIQMFSNQNLIASEKILKN